MTDPAIALFDLTGKTALVTGATSSLGRQMARGLGEAGARLMLTAGNADELERAMADLQSAGIDARWVAADSTQASGTAHLVAQTLQRMGDIDILVNHAPQGWASASRVNLQAFLMLSQAVAHHSMLARRQGCIINMAPPQANAGSPALDAVMVDAAQGAVLGLTRALAAQWAARYIRVNAICLNVLDDQRSTEAANDTLQAAQVVQPAWGDDALKGACLLFASQAGRHITGQCLTVGIGNPARA